MRGKNALRGFTRGCNLDLRARDARVGPWCRCPCGLDARAESPCAWSGEIEDPKERAAAAALRRASDCSAELVAHDEQALHVSVGRGDHPEGLTFRRRARRHEQPERWIPLFADRPGERRSLGCGRDF